MTAAVVAPFSAETASGQVAGEVAGSVPRCDYFPSYEIINSPPFQGVFFEANRRNVNHNGVDFVMRTFFEGLSRARQADPAQPATPRPARAAQPAKSSADLVCEEEMLAAFGPVGGKS